MKKNFLLVSLMILCMPMANAYSSFIVKNVKIEGLQGLSRETVYNYILIQVGERMTPKVSSKIIQNLYRTGFFENITLAYKGNTLIIQVVQRPIISRVAITGNKKIQTKKLKEALRNLGFAEGQVFNPSVLESLKTSLSREYFVIGKYNAIITVHTTSMARNRVSIKIIISEGKDSKIHQIKIIGNHAFSEKDLIHQFKLSTSGLFTFYTHADQYSREKFGADLESLRSYYMDRGYINFKVLSTQVSISPDRKQVYIAVHILEGEQYKISGYQLTGKLILPKSSIKKLVRVQVGKVFSRKDIMDSSKAIMNALGNEGYSKAHVNPVPKVDKKRHRVFLVLKVIPGPRVYVRHITFTGNYRTNDDVLRRNLLQQEGGVVSTEKVEGSKRFLLLLPYVRDVQVSTKSVSGVSDQVDVDYKVTEQPSAELRAGLGYSVSDKVMLNASVNQKNVFGTGNTFSIDLNASHSLTYLNMSYYDPFYTQSGIGRSINLFASHFAGKKANISDYATSQHGFNVAYDLRMTKNSSFQLGYGYDNSLLKIGSDPSKEVGGFKRKYGCHFYQAELIAGWSYQGLDRSIFPTQGIMQQANAKAALPLTSHKSLEYYNLTYSTVGYHPIYKNFLGTFRGQVRYGNGYGRYSGELPFFKNFYGGGMGTVRGYSVNSLGPKDSKGNSLGGNFAVDGSIGLVFPNPFSQNVRTVAFYDFGNVYDHIALNMRTSVGIEVDWLSPIALLNFSFSKAINAHKDDDVGVFQFNINSSY